jgi:hypothetical protein
MFLREKAIGYREKALSLFLTPTFVHLDLNYQRIYDSRAGKPRLPVPFIFFCSFLPLLKNSVRPKVKRQ